MFLALAFASPCAIAQSTNNQYTSVLYYTLQVADAKRIMYSIIDRDSLSKATKQAMRQVIANIDLDELAKKMTPGYESVVTTQQIGQCMHFIVSPIGQRTLAAAHDNSLQSNSRAFINALSQDDRTNFDTFMSGPCIFSNVPNAQEMHKEFFGFLHEQTCLSLAQTNQNAYSNLQHAGYCT
ncbi:MAG: hypothetical protein ACYC0F_12065 [Rhodanobacter sp.]